MPASKRIFGHLRDGRVVHSFVLSHARSGFELEILEYGAAIRGLRMPDRNGRRVDLVLSYSTLAEYEADPVYLGAVIGRCAGRTAALAHPWLRPSRNEGNNCLHGGQGGFSRALWHAVEIDDGDMPRVRLEHHSADGADGYPGNVCASIEFALVAPSAFRIIIEATTDRATPLSLTTHPYFNLSGDPGASIDDHVLRLASASMLPVRADLLPTGERLRVDDSPFDFRRAARIGARLHEPHPQLRIASGYDHYWILDDDASAAAEVFSPESGIRLSLSTNQPGLQFYSGNTLATPFRSRAGLCLEPHAFPNAINEHAFPDVFLQPGDTYRHLSTYDFSLRP